MVNHLGHTEKVHNKHYKKNVDKDDNYVTKQLENASSKRKRMNSNNEQEDDDNLINENDQPKKRGMKNIIHFSINILKLDYI